MDKQFEAYRLSADDVLKELETTAEGLSDAEAATRLEQYGPNKLDKINRSPIIFKFFRQFKDLLIILLLASAAISFYLRDARTTIILLVLVLINALIGFSQEYKAEAIMDSLKALVVPQAKVKRRGGLKEMASESLVPGDIIYIESGDSVPADVRLLSEMELSTNDFALTGESNPSRKFVHTIEAAVPLADRHNLVFMGTTVAIGEAYGIVIGTGMRTELGRIASLSQESKADPSPLQKELAHVATRITQGTLLLCAVLAAIAHLANLDLHAAFVFAIGIASAMIPQGLPAEVNISLAQAAGRLAKAKALVKKLSAVETLGATNLIGTDKTGTLTKNEMTVEKIMLGLNDHDVSGTGYQAEGDILSQGQAVGANELAKFELFCAGCALASNAVVSPPDAQHPNWYVLGDPTEGALITLARKGGINDEALNRDCPELKEFPFDSVRKMMSSVRKYDDKLTIFVKGAPEQVLKNCESIMENGKSRKLTPEDRAAVLERNDSLASQAMRNLIVAYKLLPDGADPEKLEMKDAESNLTYLGMASMIDPPRDEVYDAMQVAAAAKIPVVIITGDNPLTAKAIALKVGLAEKPEDLTLVLGDELHELSNQAILQLIDKGRVIFSRVAPEDKLRIVELAKNAGKVVAVTGDGINDAPALKRADIGVAMGRTGTDVAKQSAEIVLLDDSFSTLVKAIQQGRVIFRNIKKATISCLSSNVGELVTVLISLEAVSLAHIPIAITAVQILAIDLVAELFPIAALGWDPPDDDIMHRPPRNTRDHILNVPAVTDLIRTGLIMGGLAYGNYLLFLWRHDTSAQHLSTTAAIYASATTMTYLTICLCQFMNILHRRAPAGKTILSSYLWSNWRLLAAFGISLVCIINIIYNPAIRPFFNTGPLGAVDWLFALLAALIYGTWRQTTHYLSSRHQRLNIKPIKPLALARK